ncbi:MAG: DUF2007 domain-containing protein [Brevundimonas sp.]|uniref:putative signal transducing protein n=1 Tax=Brevundimonas sp. TaxID=1871086 RepID=UPI00273772D9|nr:DUF2007 domain-containing protein [Brevundimonas sp.]MDP3377133.1 DUF2007 domain-containing protein [Brevundimonas sp.]
MDRLEVARFSTMSEAELVVALLRRHGIDAQLADRETGSTMPHLQIALGGMRVTAPDYQVVEARHLVARARSGELADDAVSDDEGWMADATPGRVGELEDDEIHGVMGGMKRAGLFLIGGILLLSVAGCVFSMAFPKY